MRFERVQLYCSTAGLPGSHPYPRAGQPHTVEQRFLQGGPNITAHLYCICLSEHETCAYADAVHISNTI